ncbi:MAG TPA: gallate dioxygenase [Vicinamibacterales bacterium]|nr:gallate dioxygenase [Vicinamibacterales bacterium]
MATIVGAVASSHTPTIGFALDTHKETDPAWAPIFEAYKPVQQWLAEKRPDVLLLVFNDHVTSFFFDHYSQFALGIGESYAPADEGGGPRALPPVPGHPQLARHIAAGLVADEFDLAYFQDKPLDHGCFSPLSMLWPHEPSWPGAMVPLQIGVLEFPIPSARRCYKLGQSLRKAIESYPEDLKVALVATGGLSHQVHGERAGFNDTAWDLKFLDLFEKDPEQLADMTIADYAARGGVEGAEVIMWLVVRGALTPKVRKLHQSYYLPSMTGIATAIYENVGGPEVAPGDPAYMAHVDHQLAGIEQLSGSYPFTLERSVKGYRLNKFLHSLIEPSVRTRFRADEAAALAEAGLTTEEQELVRRRDWRGMIHYGVSFFMLEKLGAVIGVSNLHIYAAMRGETLEEFQKTRNTKALYSVAGTDAAKGQESWDRKG